MRNTTKGGIVHYLIINRGEDGYLGICKEFGFVEEAKTDKEIIDRLVNSSILLIETVKKNPRLEPSLNVRPPIKYWILFYIIPVWSSFVSIFSRFNGDIRLISKDFSRCYA